VSQPVPRKACRSGRVQRFTDRGERAKHHDDRPVDGRLGFLGCQEPQEDDEHGGEEKRHLNGQELERYQGPTANNLHLPGWADRIRTRKR
jgi:hypothetical protein